MTDDRNDIELIDRFLLNELTGEELNNFNKRLSEDPNFKKHLKDEKAVRAGIQYSALRKMELELETLEASLPKIELDSTKKIGHFWNTTVFKIAATLLILTIASFIVYYINSQQPVDSNLAFQQNFTPYPNEFYVPTRGETQVENDKNKAFQYYDAKDYQKALLFFEKIPSAEIDEAIIFYQANVRLALGDTENAKAEFKKVIRNEGSIFSTPSRWYLSLCYLKEGKLTEARKELQTLTEYDSEYSERATKLLNKINF